MEDGVSEFVVDFSRDFRGREKAFAVDRSFEFFAAFSQGMVADRVLAGSGLDHEAVVLFN